MPSALCYQMLQSGFTSISSPPEQQRTAFPARGIGVEGSACERLPTACPGPDPGSSHRPAAFLLRSKQCVSASPCAQHISCSLPADRAGLQPPALKQPTRGVRKAGPGHCTGVKAPAGAAATSESSPEPGAVKLSAAVRDSGKLGAVFWKDSPAAGAFHCALLRLNSTGG